MAIEGPLRDLGLMDILQLVHFSQKTGTLQVRAVDLPGPAAIHFERGAVVGAHTPGGSTRLGQLLVQSGQATGRQIARALSEQSARPGCRLGALLVESQGVVAREVERQLRFQVEEAVFELVRWTEGYFRFQEDSLRGREPLGIRLSTESLLLDALRTLDEWSALAGGPPDAGLVPSLRDGDRLLRLEPLDWEVLAAVDGERSLRAIALLLGRAQFDVARAAFSLAADGILELKRCEPEARTPLADPQMGIPGLAEVAADLRAGRLEVAARRLDAVERLAPESGDLHWLRGQLEARRGRWKEAVAALERAVWYDPLLADAHYSLAMAALHQGDLARAENALARYLRLPEEVALHRERAVRATSLIAQLQRLLEEETE